MCLHMQMQFNTLLNHKRNKVTKHFNINNKHVTQYNILRGTVNKTEE
jgi:hypothetical protein